MRTTTLIIVAAISILSSSMLQAQENSPLVGAWEIDLEKSKEFMDEEMKAAMETAPDQLNLTFGEDGTLQMSMDGTPTPFKVTYTFEESDEENIFNLQFVADTGGALDEASAKVVFLDKDVIKIVPEEGETVVLARAQPEVGNDELRDALLGKWKSNAAATVEYLEANELGEAGEVPELGFQFNQDGSGIVSEAGEDDEVNFEIVESEGREFALRVKFGESSMTFIPKVIDEDTVLLTPKGERRPIVFQRRK